MYSLPSSGLIVDFTLASLAITHFDPNLLKLRYSNSLTLACFVRSSFDAGVE